MVENELNFEIEWKYGNFKFYDSLLDTSNKKDYVPSVYNYFLESHFVKLMQEYCEVKTNSTLNSELLKIMQYDTNVEVFIDNIRYIVSRISKLKSSGDKNIPDAKYLQKWLSGVNVAPVDGVTDGHRYYAVQTGALEEFCSKFNINIDKLNINYYANYKTTLLRQDTLTRLFKKALRGINNYYVEKYNILNIIGNAFYNDEYGKYFNKNNIVGKMQLIIDQNRYNKFIQVFVNSIKLWASYYLNSIHKIDNDQSKVFLEVMSSCSLANQNKLWKEKYANYKDGCFAILHVESNRHGISNDKSYFSLSGVYDYKDQKIFNINPSECDNMKDLVEKLNNCFFKGKYTHSPLSNSCKRYAEFISSKQDSVKLMRSNKFVTLSDDYKTISTKDARILGLNYGCCERKLIASLDEPKNFSNNTKIFYIKYAPCEKCEPAIIDAKGKKIIYAIYDSPYEMKMRRIKHIDTPIRLTLKKIYL